MNITQLGEGHFPSPLRRTVDEDIRIPAQIEKRRAPAPGADLWFEKAGPRAQLFFDPAQTRAGIVTCGGLCPGLNNVIRSLFHELYYEYGVQDVLGFRFGYQGLDPNQGAEPLALTPAIVDKIHKEGGTILGTSRGPVETGLAVDHLIRRGINLFFCVGGDGTQRGANDLYEEAKRRGHPLAVVGIPKTIDNDVQYVSRTFGYLTALDGARSVIDAAHTEARSVANGVSLVKLMGRHAGFIAAGATVASQDVNFALIPEAPFRLEGERGLLPLLKQRLLKRSHAVVVVAEGAGQDLMAGPAAAKDASGNAKLQDVGLFLRGQIEDYCRAQKLPIALRYFDPSYQIRSRPANCEDAILCDRFARNAVHVAMAGKTGLVIGLIHDKFIHVPIGLIVGAQKTVNVNGDLWHAVLSATGQPARFE